MNEIARFALGIRLLKFPDGSTQAQTESLNQGMPIELIIMQMKSFLKNQENNYLKEFNSNNR